MKFNHSSKGEAVQWVISVLDHETFQIGAWRLRAGMSVGLFSRD